MLFVSLATIQRAYQWPTSIGWIIDQIPFFQPLTHYPGLYECISNWLRAILTMLLSASMLSVVKSRLGARYLIFLVGNVLF